MRAGLGTAGGKKLHEATRKIDEVGVRRRAMERVLKDVETSPEPEVVRGLTPEPPLAN